MSELLPSKNYRELPARKSCATCLYQQVSKVDELWGVLHKCERGAFVGLNIITMENYICDGHKRR